VFVSVELSREAAITNQLVWPAWPHRQVSAASERRHFYPEVNSYHGV